jgi:hypothetical protein
MVENAHGQMFQMVYFGNGENTNGNFINLKCGNGDGFVHQRIKHIASIAPPALYC